MFEEEIAVFEKENPKVKILCGGDGILVRDWRLHHKKAIIPIRNYGLCSIHEKYYRDFFTHKDIEPLKQFIYPTLSIDGNDYFNKLDTRALAEIQIVNSNPSEAMRINTYVNEQLMFENVICSGILAATKLGSTGYFKSITRTIFREGIGLAFMFPTYSIPNIVLKESDIVKIEFVRSTSVKIACDKLVYEKDFSKNETLMLSNSCNNISILGYDIFMHSECRRNRNSSLVNDTYAVL